jgi:ABC-type branched-subunit amino acid transport system substrate-binding protein
MQNDSSESFINRQEAIELFKLICEQSIEDLVSVHPLLFYIAPPGSGKTRLLEYLCQTICHASDNRVIFPYARLDFTHAQAPKDMLSILVRLRDQLQQHRDEQNRHLIFPRFDIGAAFALASSVRTEQSIPEADEIAKYVREGLSIFGQVGEIRTTLNNLRRIPPLWHLIGEHEAMLNDVLQHLDHILAWDWYKKAFQLRNNATNMDVFQRIYELSREDSHDKEDFVFSILSSAFLEDLCWSVREKHVVLFLDGFEALQDETNPMGLRLLDALLPTAYYRRSESHPLLIVAGSQMRFTERSRIERDPPFEQSMERESAHTARRYAQDLYNHWLAQVRTVRNVLQRSDLYLEFWLQDFTIFDTQAYLTNIFQQANTEQLTEDIETLARDVHTLTHGHPQALSIAATETIRAHARGDTLEPEEFQQLPALSLLLSRFLDRLSSADQQNLILCAVPRVLDDSTLRELLQLQHDLEAQRLWNRYASYTIFRGRSRNELVMHPIFRMLLLRHIQPSRDPDSDYHRVHTLLRNYFHRHAAHDKSAQIEEAYHAMALGDVDLAIDIAASIHNGNLDLWEPFIDTVVVAPTSLIAPETEQQAASALEQAQMNHALRECVAAIILYTRLLTITHEDTLQTAALQHNLGQAYHALAHSAVHEQHKAAVLEQAISSYKLVLQIYTRDTTPLPWAAAKYDLGKAYCDYLQVAQEVDHAIVKEALDNLVDALQVYTREKYYAEWLKTRRCQARVHSLVSQKLQAALPQPEDQPADNPPETSPGPTFIPPAPIRPPHPTEPNRLPFWAIIVIVVIIFSIVAFGLYYVLLNMAMLSTNDGLGLVKAPNGEDVGVSDGRVAFDIDPVAPDVRGDSDLKKQAAQKFQAGDRSGATTLWQKAIALDPSDAEAHIYLEDQKVISSGHPYITFVVAIAFLKQPYSRSIGRDSLLGAFIAQQEYNQKGLLPGGLQVRLLIANSGSAPTSTSLVAQRIAVAQKSDQTIKGVMGWSGSSRSVNAVKDLANAHIPMISQGATSDQLTHISPYFFRVVAPNSVQGMVDAKYAEQLLQSKSKRLVVFEDPADAFSQTIVHSFQQQFTADGYEITYVEHYKVGNLQDHGPSLEDALTHQPDLLYIPAPNTSDIQEFLTHMPTGGPYAKLQVLGGDTTSDAAALLDRNTWDRVNFTTVAYPDEWHLLNPTATEPPFFREYAQTYNPDNQHQGEDGFNSLSGFVMVSYDATFVLLKGSEIVMQQHPGPNFSGTDLQHGLEQIKGEYAVQGISGQIAFGQDHNPINKVLVTLHLDAQGHLVMVSSQGCFIKGCP